MVLHNILPVILLQSLKTCAPQPRGLQEVWVFISYQRSNGSVPEIVKTKVTSANLSVLFEESDTNTIDTGNFSEIPLSVEINGRGAGSIRHGNTTYLIRVRPELSGGVSCYRMNDATSAFCPLHDVSKR